MICKELTDACMEGDVVCVRALIAREANVNHVDADATHEGRYTWTPLMHAANRGHIDIVRTLIDSGAETDIRDRDSNTAIALAASAGHWHVVSLLLDHGADAAVRDHCGETAFDYALRAGQHDLASRLKDALSGKAALV